MTTDEIVEVDDSADAFGALADPKRVDILQALWEADEHTRTFSDLREAVGIRDSGQFNYHLNKLAGRFVRKTDDGYELTHAGREVVGSLLVGTYTQTGTLDPIPLDDDCPFCGGQTTFNYEDERVHIECDSCPVSIQFGVSPGVFAGYDAEDVPVVARRYLQLLIRRANDGFCPMCDGRIEPSVEIDPDGQPDGVSFPLVYYDCERCGEEVITELGTALVEVPDVLVFFADHDIDVRDAPFSQFVVTDERVTVREDDPLEVAVEFVCEDEALTVVVDEHLTVLSTERE